MNLVRDVIVPFVRIHSSCSLYTHSLPCPPLADFYPLRIRSLPLALSHLLNPPQFPRTLALFARIHHRGTHARIIYNQYMSDHR